MSRTVNSEHCLDVTAKEVMRKQLWKIADFCGVQILTYALMSNHFHVLVRVPLKTEVPDAELLRRFKVLYPKPTKYQTARIEVIEEKLKRGEAGAWRKQQLALMGDVSQFMKLFKQRFAIWFNSNHGRHGPFWCERFKSVLVEGRANVLTTMAAYIDLNPVRAGLAVDPKDYRFCGYAEAVAGKQNARDGIAVVVTGESGNSLKWRDAHDAYRTRLFGAGAIERPGKASISPGALEKVMAAKGTLPIASVLRCRARYFTSGVVLGSKAFVAGHLATYKKLTDCRRRPETHPLPEITDWGDLATMRGFRKTPFG